MTFRHLVFIAGFVIALPFLVYLLYLSHSQSVEPTQIIFLAFAFSVTFPTLILMSLLLFRSLGVLVFALPAYIALIIAGYTRTYMAFGIQCGGQATQTLRDCLYYSVAIFTNTGCPDCAPAPELRILAASEAFFGYLALGVFCACLIVILVRLIASDTPRR
ncbi:Ion channel [Desulfolutivibrio sulfoxidireducens]|uniref:Ion channel n=1 Tax=Desulfolutivibrio sulfoxidireducens TaxID=2773299 RepID=UPI00159D7001|nr:Ion channel [Desulfolutivibrio sulfoxidireducens]QLA15574.1 Ion channel [Desulfolutivibrio sulfoxidireducens]QLA19177.1 Ion channel [Desulfolutivibrio sulfoxidireducens]